MLHQRRCHGELLGKGGHPVAVALSLSADAVVASTTGALTDQTDRGTHEHRDAFEVPAITVWANAFALLHPDPRKRDRRVACLEGAEDCSKYRSTPCLGGAETRTTLTPEPQQAGEGDQGQPLDDPKAPPAPGAKPTTVRSATKRTERRSVVATAQGTVSMSFSSWQTSSLMRELGVSKSGSVLPTVGVSAMCGDSAPAAAQVQFGG